MLELTELKRRMREDRPQDWDVMPDLGLYMDQVLSYMPRQLIDLGETETLTAAMVNNYIKDGLMPRAAGKKYTRAHLAYLTAICALKQVISVKGASQLIHGGERLSRPPQQEGGSQPPPDEPMQQLYSCFCEELNQAMLRGAEDLPDAVCREELPRLALSLALNSYAHRLACQRILRLMEEAPDEAQGKPRRKP